MRLPKIQEDQCALKNTYFNSITEKSLKKYKTDKLIFDWQKAQAQLIAKIPDQENVLQPLIQLQSLCKQQQIPHFYSYFFVSKLLYELQQPIKQNQVQRKPNSAQMSTRRSEMIRKTNLQISQIQNKKSRWNKILQLIQLRENLISKINGQVLNNKLEVVYTHLDDIRFINFQIIKKIRQWSEAVGVNSDFQPFFLYQGKNYAIKMINDNTNVINALNQKAVKFLSPPNPFYLSRDGNKASMSQTQQMQIDNGMEFLAKEKAQQLKMMLNPPKFVTQAKNDTNQLKKLKNQLQEDRIQRIRNVYKSNAPFSSSMTSLRLSVYSSQKNKEAKLDNKNKNQVQKKNSTQKAKLQKPEIQNKRNKLEKLIQEKQVQIIQQMKTSQVKGNKQIKQDKKSKQKAKANKYISRVQSLRKSVQNNNNLLKDNKASTINSNENRENGQTKAENLMRLSTISNKSNMIPKSVAQVKAPKPKIKLIMQKQSIVADVLKTFLPSRQMEIYKSMNVRKTSNSFFKQTQKQVEQKSIGQNPKQKKQSSVDIKPITQYNRTLSASKISQRKLTSSKIQNSLNISKQKSKIVKKEKKDNNKSRSLTKSILSQFQSPRKQSIIDNQVKANLQSESNIRAVNSKLKQLTIMSIYGKKMKSASTIYSNPYDHINQKATKKTENKKQQKNRIEVQLAAVKNRLKELSIKKIYDRKLNTKGFSKGNTIDTNQIKQKDSIVMQKQYIVKQKNQLKQKNQIKQKSLVEKQKRIKRQNEIKEKQLQGKQQQRISLLEKLSQKDKRIQQLLKMMQKQQKQQEQKKEDNLVNNQQQILRLQRSKKMAQIEQLKQKLKSENKLIKQQMKNQEKKYIQLKQKQFQIKQQQMAKKYELDMQQMKQQYIKKNQELEAKIFYQQKKRKQNQIKIMQQHRQMEQLRMQMQQKQLKEQILEQVLRQQKQKEQLELQLMKQNEQLKKDRLKRQILQKQEMQRKILQNFEQENKKLVQMFEMMKRKNEAAEKQNQLKLLELRKIQQQAKVEQQNLRKLQQQLLQAQGRLELQLQNEKSNQKRNQPAEQETSLGNKQSIEQIKLKVKQQILRQMMNKRKEQQQQLKIEQQQRARKLAQIQQQIKKQLRKQQQQMQRIEKQQKQRYNRIKQQMEEQHQKKMDQLNKGLNDKQKQLQEVKKNNRQNSKEVEKSMKQQPDQQQNYKISKQQYQKQLQNALEASKLQMQQRSKYQQLVDKKQIKTIQQQQKPFQKKKEIQKQKQVEKNIQIQNQVKIPRDQNRQKLEKNIQELKINQQKNIKNQNRSPQKQQSQNKQAINETKQRKEQENIIITKNKGEQSLKQKQKLEQNKQNIEKGQNKQSVIKQKQITQKDSVREKKEAMVQNNKQQQGKKQNQSQFVKQPAQQILNKYQSLQQYLSKCKQIFIDDRAVPQFLNNFFNQLAVQLKQMLPFTSDQLLKIMINIQKKADIFQCPNGHSIGWIQQDKYVLIGQISCVQNIVRKYGQIQIQMTYIFNKTNPYQKQFLAKQVKIFDKVGYIFQKKLKQQNMFSIKLIIKVPHQILPKNFKAPRNQLNIESKITIDLITKSKDILQNRNYSYEYLLSGSLKNCLSAEEQLELKQDKNQESVFISKKMHYKLYNDTSFKSIEVGDKIIKIQANLGFKYIQTHDFPCYLTKGFQYINKNAGSNANSVGNNEKIFTAPINTNLTAVFLNYDKSCQQFSVDILLNIKFKKIEKQRQLLLCVPIWKKSESLTLNKPGPKQFSFTYNVESNLTFGSIVSTNIFKQEYKFIQVPFLFALFETSDSGLLLRPLLGQIVKQQHLIKQKR